MNGQTADWLMGLLPVATAAQQREWIDGQMAANPPHIAISDEEAEAFAALCYMLQNMGIWTQKELEKALFLANGERGGRSARQIAMRAVRRWKDQRYRAALIHMTATSGMQPYAPSAGDEPRAWTEERFLDCYDEGICIAWLAQVRRFLKPHAEIRPWVKGLDEDAELFYDIWLDAARLSLCRLVYTEQADAEPPEQVAMAQLAADVRVKAERSAALRKSVRHLEQDQKRLKEEARRIELEKQAVLRQAEGEVAAARRELAERRTARERELAEQRRRMEAELQTLAARLTGARDAFLQQLGGLERNLLLGRTVAIDGSDLDAQRRLVETLGGVALTGDAPEAVPARQRDPGLLALERRLHLLLLRRVEIRCDGSRRRRGSNPPIAAAAFQAYAGEQVLHGAGRVVACGPAVSSQMAEFGALVMALRWLRATGVGDGCEVTIRSDCRYMVDHINGKRPAPDMTGCRQLDGQVQGLLRVLARRGCQVRLTWVRRQVVDAEDRLCDVVYREAGWYQRPGKERLSLPLAQFLRSGGLR